MAARTGAERYFEEQRENPEYERAYQEAAATVRRRIDVLVTSIDARREERGLSKAELARKAGLPPEAVRRLFTMRSPNPTATTLVALARALELDLVAAPRTKPVRRIRSRLARARAGERLTAAARRNTVRRLRNSARYRCRPLVVPKVCRLPNRLRSPSMTTMLDPPKSAASRSRMQKSDGCDGLRLARVPRRSQTCRRASPPTCLAGQRRWWRLGDRLQHGLNLGVDLTGTGSRKVMAGTASTRSTNSVTAGVFGSFHWARAAARLAPPVRLRRQAASSRWRLRAQRHHQPVRRARSAPARALRRKSANASPRRLSRCHSGRLAPDRLITAVLANLRDSHARAASSTPSSVSSCPSCQRTRPAGSDTPRAVEHTDLAAHLVLREHDYVAAPGLVVPGAWGHFERRRVALKEIEFTELVATVRSGPPPGLFRPDGRVGSRTSTSSTSTTKTCAEQTASDHANTARRGQRAVPQRQPCAAGSSPDGCAAWASNSSGQEQQGHHRGARATSARLHGLPGELLLFLFGRRDAAHVEITGSSEAIEAVRLTPFGM